MCINPGQIAVLIMRLNGTIFVFIDMPETLVKWSWTTVCDQGLRKCNDDCGCPEAAITTKVSVCSIRSKIRLLICIKLKYNATLLASAPCLRFLAARIKWPQRHLQAEMMINIYSEKSQVQCSVTSRRMKPSWQAGRILEQYLESSLKPLDRKIFGPVLISRDWVVLEGHGS
ncbi:hypothetical protein Y1Q_0007790 [Alligator mississippiensis]|uniref:Uncharacterized protein n=1 Tax=Alligator mississippiensis TaxID=8496 RepID=A0A151N7V6_ALLMI|nr:hypothetical protein Y1Q_0007790 [Alligator mississippiensis]